MRNNLYKKGEANFPRFETDSFFADFSNRYKYDGFIEKAFSFVENTQLLKPALWKRFVQQFREDADFDAGWRGEYWGKMMRGAAFVYSSTKNEKLYDIMTETVKDILTAQDKNGRISSYAESHEFDGWDIWGRKYVLLGMQYYLEICKDEELSKKVIKSMELQTDYIISKIGDEDGKKPITKATRHWRGLNSASLLEPVVRLYNITGKQKYFDFAEYIVNTGGTDIVNIFDLAYKNDFYPYQYPVTKAYEMTSCFEGLMEFYRITGNERYKQSIINYADRILESDFTVIGSSGCTHELFDHSTFRQSNTTNGIIQQETCVTVTLMKFFFGLTLLTGDSKYADAFEISLYNAYLGSLNTENQIESLVKEEHSDWTIEALPFDSYSPLTSGTRGNGIGGLKVMSDNHYYGCCACIGSAGIGLVPKMELLSSRNGFVLNLFINGEISAKTPENKDAEFLIKTDYPKSGNVTVTLNMAHKEDFEIKVRNPLWSEKTSVFVNGEEQKVNSGYISLDREWKNGDKIEINLDMKTELIKPVLYGTDILMNKVIWGGANYIIPAFDRQDKKAAFNIAIKYGPVMFAQDTRLGYETDVPVSIDKENIKLEIKDIDAPYSYIVGAEVLLKDGNKMSLTDYASTGKLWDKKHKTAVWILTDEEI